MGKCINANALVDLLKLVRAHGLYPVLDDKCMNNASLFVIMHHNTVNGNSSLKAKTQSKLTSKLETPLPTFEDVQSCFETTIKVQWTKQVKPLVTKKICHSTKNHRTLIFALVLASVSSMVISCPFKSAHSNAYIC